MKSHACAQKKQSEVKPQLCIKVMLKPPQRGQQNKHFKHFKLSLFKVTSSQILSQHALGKRQEVQAILGLKRASTEMPGDVSPRSQTSCAVRYSLAARQMVLVFHSC